MKSRLKLFLALLLAIPTAAEAQYVWNGDDGTTYTYSGTQNPPWGSDTTKSGKWIVGKSNALLDSSGTWLTIADSENLTIENATASVGSAFQTQIFNSTVIINSGGVLNVQKGLWMAQGSKTSKLTVNTGGTLNISGSTSYLSDSNAGKAIIDVNGGKIVSTLNLNLGHHGAMETTVHNGGALDVSASSLIVGAGDSGSASTNISASRVLTIGTANSTTDNSIVSAKGLIIGNNANGKIVLNSGKFEVGTSGLVIGGGQDGILEANGGALSVSGTVTVGNATDSNYDATTGYVQSTIANTTLNLSGALNVKNGYLTIKDIENEVTVTGLTLDSQSSARLTLENVNLKANYTKGTTSGLYIQTANTTPATDQAELIIGKDAHLTLSADYFWMSKDENKKSRLVIKDGGQFETDAASCLVDKLSSTGELVIDNGSYKSTALILLGHRGYLNAQIVNGGTLSTTNALSVGGGNVDNSDILLGEVTVGTEGVRDGSVFSGNEIYIGNKGKGKLTAYGATISSNTSLIVGHEIVTNSAGVKIPADGELYASDSVVSAGGTMTFGNNAKATVQISDSVISAKNLVIGATGTGSGEVMFNNSTVNIPSLSLNRGTLTLKNSDMTIPTGAFTVGSNSAVNTTLSLENSTFTVADKSYFNTTETSGNYKASLIINNGGVFNAKLGLWLSNSANARSYVEINKGGVLDLGAESYLSDNRSNAYAEMYVNGGTLNSQNLNVGWWGPMDLEVANGGQILATGNITFNSNSDASTSSTDNELTISGSGSLIKASGNITFGKNSTRVATVNLNLSDSGFGKIEANTISMNNGSFVFDAQQPIAVIENYVEGKGVLLIDAKTSLANFGAAKTSGDWTAAQTGNQVWATRDISGLNYLVDGTPLVIPQSAVQHGAFTFSSSSDPFLMTLQLQGLSDLAETQSLADLLNNSFDTLSVEATDVNQLSFSGLDRNLSNALISYDFRTLGADYSDVGLSAVRAQSVPEPASWLLILVGMLFLAKSAKLRRAAC